MPDKRQRRRLVLLCCCALVCAGVSAAGASRRQRAAKAYEKALQLRTQLEARPERKQKEKDYARAIKAFDVVYRTDPGYPKTPAALNAVAELNVDAGRLFENDRYYLQSIEAYRFLIREYPQASLVRSALWSIAVIYHSSLNDPEAAREAFQEFLEKYPHSTEAPRAREEIRKINLDLAKRAAPAREPYPPTLSSSAPAPDLGNSREAEVNAVRDWQAANSTRVVIALDNDAKYEALRLANPDRIVFDLLNAHVSQALSGKTFPVEGGFLQDVRVAQFRPNIARIVLDVGQIDDYSVFSLPNPFRLIIDVHGPASATATAKAAPAGDRPAGAPQAAGGARGSGSVDADYDKPAPVATGTLPASSPAGTAPAVSNPAPAPVRAALPTASGSTTLTRALGLKIGRIVIDPGHGGHDTGTIGPTGLREKDVVLDVGLRLRRLLEQRMGATVVMTRSDDTFIPLEERTAIANEKNADLFISIHANASRDPSARGIETYYLNFSTDPHSLEVAARENATSEESVHQLQSLIKKIALTEKVEESTEFARQVQRSLYAATESASGAQRDRGLKKAPFVVLIGANMPSILSEISFLSNPRDERLLRRPEYRQKIAEALYRGIGRYVANLNGVRVAARSPGPSTRRGALAPSHAEDSDQ